jgi:hypothetical protein
MAAGYQDLFIEQGTTFSTEINLDDSYGTPYDLTNFSVKSQAKKSYYTNTISLEFDASIINPAAGTISISADAHTTANIAPGKMVYDVIITELDTGTVTRVLEGQIFLSPSVTSY